jgi:C_GCAxxG_C_C family probable redox protein
MRGTSAAMNNAEKAVDLFCAGYNCSQSTAAAFAEELGIDDASALAMMAGFGGGVAGKREMCGAVSGLVFVLSLANGTYDPKDNDAKTALYKNISDGIAEFSEQFGTTCCRELLLKAGCLPKPEPSVRNAEYYAKRPCAHFVAAAAEIAARRMKKS